MTISAFLNALIVTVTIASLSSAALVDRVDPVVPDPVQTKRQYIVQTGNADKAAEVVRLAGGQMEEGLDAIGGVVARLTAAQVQWLNAAGATITLARGVASSRR